MCAWFGRSRRGFVFRGFALAMADVGGSEPYRADERLRRGVLRNGRRGRRQLPALSADYG